MSGDAEETGGREKKVEVVGYPPAVVGPPAEPESDSDEERVEEGVPDASGGEDDEKDEEEEGIDELMDAFGDNETEIDLTHLRITSLRPLHLARFAETLERLILRQNLITSMRSRDFAPLTKLKELDLYDNSIQHINGLEHNTALEVLDLSYNSIRHVSRVSQLGHCHTLYLVQNKVTRVREGDLKGPIAGSLRSLELGGNRLRSLENLGHLEHLTELWVGKNKIPSLTVRLPAWRGSLQGIASLTNLRVLSIQSNRLTSLDGLQTLTALEELYVAHNGLTHLEGLEHNTNLTTLDIAGNQIESLDGIAHLHKLTQFWANDNRINNINNVDKYLGPKVMPDLETVYLEGNPAQRAEGSSYRRKIQLGLPQITQLDATLLRR
ncbi:protein phosphatase regulatory subunit Sds22 [Malassezia sp. CBS 17886]|nr:protein phosphatase regulatory subunit Sds22 [Malassezia sp. CBS 17886]